MEGGQNRIASSQTKETGHDVSETGEGGGENKTASKGVNAFFDQCEQAILADPADSDIDSKHIFSLLARALALMTKMVKETHPKKPAIIRKLVPTVSKLLKSPILSKPSPEMSQAYSSALAVVSLQDWKNLGQESIANDSNVFLHDPDKKLGSGEPNPVISTLSKTSDSFPLKSAKDNRIGTGEAAKRNPSSQGGTMMKKNRPVEIDTTASSSSKTWENSIIVKASREIVSTANSFFKSQQDLVYEEPLVAAIMEIVQAIDLPSLVEDVGLGDRFQIEKTTSSINTSTLTSVGSTGLAPYQVTSNASKSGQNMVSSTKGASTFRVDILELLEGLSESLKSLTNLQNYTTQRTGLIEFLYPHFEAVVKLCFEFSNRRDLARHELGCAILLNLVKCYRNLFYSSKHQDYTLEVSFIELLFQVLQNIPSSESLRDDILRILAKISWQETFFGYVWEQKNHLDFLMKMLGTFKDNSFVVMRICHILTELTTGTQEDIACYIYSNDKGVIFSIFEQAFSKIKKDDDMPLPNMLKSFANFDPLNEDPKKVLNKVIRLMTNLFTIEEPATHFISQRFASYKQLLKKLKFFMNDKDLIHHSELLQSVLNCITNILFYDKPHLAQNDFELASIKNDLAGAVSYIALQPQDEEILIDGLRVISNLSLAKDGVKTLLELKFQKAILVLLKHRRREVVYYSIGILINLSINQEFKQGSTCREIFMGLVELLEDSTIDDTDILKTSLKALVNLINDNLKPSMPGLGAYFSRLDKVLTNFGEECDIILSSDDCNEEITPDELELIRNIRSLINAVVNVCPEEEHECSVAGCMRKFNTKVKLEQHIARNHQTAGNTSSKENLSTSASGLGQSLGLKELAPLKPGSAASLRSHKALPPLPSNSLDN